ncbi:Lrp/AsnC family transcriptional regulator [Pseudoalteromonas denitrificans]|uniref:siroheme decarboxylase n=1 Tax=Pseudoalteromonas denitrificans DSM 6059 TaxID=1123010 RepID=A0A1I1N2V7_9GAMM|nr:Lrp/AsnC family transcriptional regulator [Pseudoalteromonas denitrificans]SFC88120.1 DNA-binding transcriptional regulator, Lrp family [Pseudoalteromonas denitrificans DSM 6059]
MDISSVIASKLTQQLINAYQRGFPLCSRPFLQLANEFNTTEQTVIDCLNQLKQTGILSRLGPVFDHKRAGSSTLAAISVKENKIDEIANLVNEFEQVNHNYAREHKYNLWFVVTGANRIAVYQTIKEIEQATQHEVLVLPMEKSYYIDLSFDVSFNQHQKAS